MDKTAIYIDRYNIYIYIYGYIKARQGINFFAHVLIKHCKLVKKVIISPNVNVWIIFICIAQASRMKSYSSFKLYYVTSTKTKCLSVRTKWLVFDTLNANKLYFCSLEVTKAEDKDKIQYKIPFEPNIKELYNLHGFLFWFSCLG